jgi:hypothetical protein
MFRYMGLAAIHALDHQAVCDRCGKRSAPVHSESFRASRREAVERLLAMGWTHRVVGVEKAPLAQWFHENGAGEWACLKCSDFGP